MHTVVVYLTKRTEHVGALVSLRKQVCFHFALTSVGSM